MKTVLRPKVVQVVIASVVLLLGFGGMALAQAPYPQDQSVPSQVAGPQSIQAALGTAITYQGQIRRDTGPITGTCDFQFSLWDAAGSGSPPTGGSQVGTTQTKTGVSIFNGLFTIPDLDFGGSAFTGDARWLQIAVKCAGDAGYATLAPRQALTPVPYALALPGLRTQQNATSPNIIGGYSGNSVWSYVVGASIGGGGAAGSQNYVTDHYGTICGGANNLAGNDGSWGVDPSDASYATVGGGDGNTARNPYATVGGGRGNMASDIYTTIGGGYSNTVTADAATVGGGRGNRATADYGTVPGGYEALASHYGELAYASGAFATAGDAQASVYVLRRTSNNGGELFLDGSGRRLTIANRRVIAFDILAIGYSFGGAATAFRVEGVIRNDGITSLIGTPTTRLLGGDDRLDVIVEADDDWDALVVRVVGYEDITMRWVAVVRTAEIAW